MLKHNYHTHTVFCKHASNEPEEMVKQAIKSKLETLGFSEHIQMPKDRGLFRLANDHEEQEYIKAINNLKKQYQDRLTIYCGFECDILNPHDGKELYTYASKKLALPGVDYLIIGHHWYSNGQHVYNYRPTMAEAKEWIEVLEKAWATKKFTYIAHPDGFANAYQENWDEVAFYLAEAITTFAAKNNIPLGFNVNGIYDQKAYPSLKFWKIAAQNKAIAHMELDAHNLDVFDDHYLNQAIKMIKASKVKIIDKLF